MTDPIVTPSAGVLEDAKLAAAHASARGRIEDASVLDRLAALEGKKPANFTPADEQELNKIVNTLAKWIHPLSIEELRKGQDGSASFLTRMGQTARAYSATSFSIPASIFVVCIVVIIAIIPLTTLYNRLTLSIVELREVEEKDFFSILYQGRSLWQEVAADKSKTEQATDLRNSIKRLRELESKINVNNLAIYSTVDLSLGAPRWVTVILAAYGLGSSSVSPVSAGGAAASAEASPAASGPAAATPCTDQDDVCWNKQFMVAYGLGIAAADVSAAYFNRRQAEAAASLLGGSMLPVLYGLLGASVYLLRRYLGETTGELERDLAMRAYLRLGLGGIAGLAIGWFWAPTVGKTGVEGVVNLSTAPFALAFLAGFSIELLFSILDRIIAAINPNTAARSPAGPRQAGPAVADAAAGPPSEGAARPA
jgi:hypothetical protein